MLKPLSQLNPGENGVVSKVTGGGSIHRRIIDMGIVPGTLLKVEKYAPLGDPIEIKVKGFNLSLRKTEAEMIQVEVA
jgi:ferrous iron transport protein A